MAAEQKERTAKLAEKRQELGEQELRHTAPYGTRQMLDDLMLWHEVEEVSSASSAHRRTGRDERPGDHLATDRTCLLPRRREFHNVLRN